MLNWRLLNENQLREKSEAEIFIESKKNGIQVNEQE